MEIFEKKLDSNTNNNYKLKRYTDFYYDEKIDIYEDENYEFKQFIVMNEHQIYHHLRLFMKYFSAFLNSNDGILYFGINDDGIVKGIELTPDLKQSFEVAINSIISSYDSYIKENNNITYTFYPLKYNHNRKEPDRYVIEIYIKVGEPDHIYCTPFKDEDTNDYECYIKLNGTVKKIQGNYLYQYTKKKIMKYVLNSIKK